MEDKIFKNLSDYLFEQESRKLVGKVMKRFENSDDKEQIKREVKELLYEWVRDFRDSFNTGKFVLKMVNESKELNNGK
jgi:hypothetical protein